MDDPFDMEAYMKFVVSTRWIFNFFMAAIPWAGFGFLMLVYNIVFNAWLNKGWAEGNFFLLFNTYFCIF
jgi:hypothetical protein